MEREEKDVAKITAPALPHLRTLSYFYYGYDFPHAQPEATMKFGVRDFASHTAEVKRTRMQTGGVLRVGKSFLLHRDTPRA